MSLPYWIEAVDGRVFFKVPELKANQIHKFVLMKEGNYSPSGDNVFEFFDDFSAETIDTSKWNTDGTIEINDGVASFGYGEGIRTHQTFNTGHMFEVRAYSNGGSDCTFITLINGNNNHQLRTDFGTGIKIENFKNGSGTTHVPSWDSVRTLRDYTVNYQSSSLIVFSQDSNTYTFNNSAYISGIGMYLDIGAWSSAIMYVDSARVRKIASTEPTVSVEDKGGYYLITVTENSGTDLTDYQIHFDAADISLSSVDESLKITEGGPKYIDVMGINIIR